MISIKFQERLLLNKFSKKKTLQLNERIWLQRDLRCQQHFPRLEGKERRYAMNYKSGKPVY